MAKCWKFYTYNNYKFLFVSHFIITNSYLYHILKFIYNFNKIKNIILNLNKIKVKR